MEIIYQSDKPLSNVHNVRMPVRKPLTRVTVDTANYRCGGASKNGIKHIEAKADLPSLLIEACLKDYRLYPWQLKGSATLKTLINDHMRFELILDNQVFEDRSFGYTVLQSFGVSMIQTIPRTKSDFVALNYFPIKDDCSPVDIETAFSDAVSLCNSVELPYLDSNIRLVLCFKKAGLDSAVKYYTDLTKIKK